MMKPRFVVFRQRRYGFKKISMKNISGEKSYDLQLFDYFSTFSKFENFQIFSFGNSGDFGGPEFLALMLRDDHRAETHESALHHGLLDDDEEILLDCRMPQPLDQNVDFNVLDDPTNLFPSF